MTAHWVVEFNGRAGGRARAVFSSQDEARAFAERHARAVTADGVPLKWSDSNDAVILSTVIGDYCVARINPPEPSRR